MLLTDYFRSQHDATWDIARQCGVRHGVIRLPEDDDFDICQKTHWDAVHKRFTDFGIKPVIIEPMPNALHDHIKAGDAQRDECIEKVIKMLPIMRDLDIRTICFNWMAHIGWLRTRSDYPERGGTTVTAFDMEQFTPTGAKITADELWHNYRYFLDAVLPEAEKNGIQLALHPDDPPVPRLGDVERIMISGENIRKGETVKALQTLLIGYGYSCGSYGADGDFGNGTDKAVKAYQKAKGLEVDGIVGTNTWKKLLGV